jgi:tetratricopeptide (TPR) repeat protein
VNNGQTPQAEKCDEIAYNSARAFQAARLVAKAITVRRALLAFDEKTKGNSPLAKKATYEIGGNYQAIAVYDLAAEWYEKYAKNDPNAPEADKALADAVILRLGLGQEDEAIKDAAVFTKNYGARKPAQTAAVAYAVGAHYVDTENWDKAVPTLSNSMGTIDKAAPDIQVQAHAALARAFIGKFMAGGDANASREYAKVRALWTNPGDAEAKIKQAYPTEDEAQKERRLGKALNAVGEAYFFSAEQTRKSAVEPVKFPAYTGPGDKATVMKHIETKVKDWYTKKRDAIVKTEPEYFKILELKPKAPPKWVIAAGSRSGLMWGDFVDDFRRAPIPAAWKSDPEIRGVYYDRLDAASEPFKVQHAKPALKKCLDLSVQQQYFDDFSRACEVWLAKNYGAEYHLIDEFRGAPNRVAAGLTDKPLPLNMDGTFFKAEAPVEAADTGAKSDGGAKDQPKPATSSDANQSKEKSALDKATAKPKK